MKKIYCIHCGKKNNKKNKYCNFCHQKLKEKDRVLFDYLFDQSLSDMKDTVISNAFDKIKYFLKKYLYGIVLSITVVTSVVSNIIIRNDYSQVVDSKPIFNKKVFVKYNSADNFMQAFTHYYTIKDKDSIKMMLFDNAYPEKSITLSIDTSKMPYIYDESSIKDISLIEQIDTFSRDNLKIFYTIKNTKDIPSENLKYYSDLAVRLVREEIDTYIAETTFVYYDNDGEETYFDLDFVLVNIEDSYYIAGIYYLNPDDRIEDFIKIHSN